MNCSPGCARGGSSSACASRRPSLPTLPSATPVPSHPPGRPPARVAHPAPLAEGDAHALQDLLPENLAFGRWRVISVLPVKLGGVPVVLESRRGERFQVDILRRDRSARARRGLTETRSYSLFLVNRGQGDTPTREDHGLGVLWLAALLRHREHRLPAAALLTQRERTQRFPRGKFNALVVGAGPQFALVGAPATPVTSQLPEAPATPAAPQLPD